MVHLTSRAQIGIQGCMEPGLHLCSRMLTFRVRSTSFAGLMILTRPWPSSPACEQQAILAGAELSGQGDMPLLAAQHTYLSLFTSLHGDTPTASVLAPVSGLHSATVGCGLSSKVTDEWKVLPRCVKLAMLFTELVPAMGPRARESRHSSQSAKLFAADGSVVAA